MKFSVFQISRKGGREKNEDRMGYCYTKSAGLFLLADGMGGHPEGDVAAHLALQTIAALFQQQAKPELSDVKAFISAAIDAAHGEILRYAQAQNLSDAPRTTLVVAVIQNHVAYWAHCGDSRLYFVRDAELLARTRDHSYAEHPQAGLRVAPVAFNRNVLYTCLGAPTHPVVDMVGPVPLQQGDKIMLCSDGLWGNLDDADIVHRLGHQAVSQSAPELVELALLKGGPTSDNVTLVSLEWETPATMDATFDTAASPWVDDAGLVRSIAEIREAIQRTTVRKI